ncbi:zinc ribbon domain-containing protein [Nocardia sp. NPDC059246]|uniref:zinc ribbon domain-containing protein n=1 Tax=Nocardia sp. NPDC059246 TaxID=3346789 RepID=UPI0036C7C5B9
MSCWSVRAAVRKELRTSWRILLVCRLFGLLCRAGDAGFCELRPQLGYKIRRNGGKLVVADRFYPSSKTCSSCGLVKAELALSERVFVCDRCGLVLDRDLNAARNLAVLESTRSCGGTINMPDGNHVRPGSPGSGIATGRPETAVAGQPCPSNRVGHAGRHSA